jgi:RecB family endonuclease NucS
MENKVIHTHQSGDDNTKDHPQLIVDWVRSIQGFENYSHTQIAELIQYFTKLAQQLHVNRVGENLNENKLLNIVRSGDYDKVTIEFKEKRMHTLILSKVQSMGKKFVDLLKENPFQKIIVKSHRGKVARVETSTKIKL